MEKRLSRMRRHRRSEEAYQRFQRFAEIPMVALALPFLPVVAEPLLTELSVGTATALESVAWPTGRVGVRSMNGFPMT